MKKMQVVKYFTILSLLTIPTSIQAAEIWSEPTNTKQWSEPTNTEQWSEPTNTEQWSEPTTTEQWSEPTNTEQWSTSTETNVQPVSPISITFDVPPRVENGRSLVPLRKIFEVLGATIEWDGATQTIKATKENTIILLVVNSKTAFIDNKPTILDVPAKIVSGRTLVPLRFVSEALGYPVEYEAKTTKVVINNQFFFYINPKLANSNSSSSTSTNPQPASDVKTLMGKWFVWVSGGWTAPDPQTGISTYTKGAAGGTLQVNSNGTFVWDMKTAVYRGVWLPNPNDSKGIILKSTDGWDYTLKLMDSKTIKWYSYGLEYYGTRN